MRSFINFRIIILHLVVSSPSRTTPTESFGGNTGANLGECFNSEAILVALAMLAQWKAWKLLLHLISLNKKAFSSN